MRGATLFAGLFIEENTSRQPIKGRNADLNAKRNECILDRYYFYGKFFNNSLSYNYITNKIAEEFWLSSSTVTQLLEDNFEKLGTLKRIQPSLRDLREKWPQWNWQVA